MCFPVRASLVMRFQTCFMLGLSPYAVRKTRALMSVLLHVCASASRWSARRSGCFPYLQSSATWEYVLMASFLPCFLHCPQHAIGSGLPYGTSMSARSARIGKHIILSSLHRYMSSTCSLGATCLRRVCACQRATAAEHSRLSKGGKLAGAMFLTRFLYSRGSSGVG